MRAKKRGKAARPAVQTVVEFNSHEHEVLFDAAWQGDLAIDCASHCGTLKQVAWAAFQEGFNLGAKAQREAKCP